MSEYHIEAYVRDTEAEMKYTFAEIQWGKIVAIHHHWVPLDEFYKFFEANSMFIDITGVLIEGEPPAIGDTVIGSLEEGYKILHIRNTYTPEERREYVIEKLKLTRDQKELDIVEYNGIRLDADKTSQTRMEKARMFLEDNDIPSITWTTADNNRIEMTVADFKAVNTLIAVRSNNLHIRYNELKTYILSLDSSDTQLNEIDWDFEIPQKPDPNEEDMEMEQYFKWDDDDGSINNETDG